MLSPNYTFTLNGVTIKEKIIPDGTRWQSDSKAKTAGFTGAGALYKSGRSFIPKKVTIHNTNDLAAVFDDGEQYTRATYPNENMGSARVHFYVDDSCGWQNLKAGTGMSPNDLGSAEVSWHAGDGSVADGGNMTSLSIEIIMGEGEAHDAKAYDNGARLAAWLLWKHKLPLSALVTHTYWVNKSAGKRFVDVDEQCTNLIPKKKWCPTYIFGSTNHNTALKNWKAFKNLVGTYLDKLNGKVSTPTTPTVQTETKNETIEKGDLVRITGSQYYGGKTIPAWVKAKAWYVKSVVGTRAVIDKSEDGKNAICSPVSTSSLSVLRKNDTSSFKEGDKVKCNSDAKYSSGKSIPAWVKKSVLYVRGVEQSGKVLLLSTEPTKKVYTGRVNASDVHKI